MGARALGTDLGCPSPLLIGAEARSAPCFMRELARVTREYGQSSGSRTGHKQAVCWGRNATVSGRITVTSFRREGANIEVMIFRRRVGGTFVTAYRHVHPPVSEALLCQRRVRLYLRGSPS